jgi:DNA-binding MarR family transcriptional regulator
MGRPVEKLLCETRQVFQALAEASDEALRSRGLSAREQGLLKVLARKPRPVTVAALARTTLATVRDTNLALAALRDRGWVNYQTEWLDSRRGKVAMSPLGHTCWVELHACERILIDRLTAGLDEQALHSTFTTLRAVRRLLQRPLPPQAPSHQ